MHFVLSAFSKKNPGADWPRPGLHVCNSCSTKKGKTVNLVSKPDLNVNDYRNLHYGKNRRVLAWKVLA